MEKESVNPILRQIRTMVAKQPVKDRTDLELLQQFTSTRDESAFAALVARHGALVWNVCQRVLHHRHDAEDAFQATFLVLARQAGTVCKKEALGSWLHGVAYRTALSQKRADQRRRRRENQEPSREVEQPVSAASLRELQAMLDEELARLPAKYRSPFVLCCLEGRSNEQAARELDCKEGTVSSRLAHARKLLQDRLTRRGVTLSSVPCAAAFSPTIEAAPAALVAATSEGVLQSLRGTAAAALSAQAVILANGATKTLSATALKLAAIILLAAVPLACVGLWAKQESVAQQQAESEPQAPPPLKARRAKAADDKKDFADAEMHVLGVSQAKNMDKGKGSIEVEVRPTAKPIVLVLTAYLPVEWHIKPAKGARIKKAILSGYHAQEIKGLLADVPVSNRSYFREDGSQRKVSWFWAYQWNLPQWRHMVRRLNEMTGLPIASFQGKRDGDSFIVDGKRGRDQGQNGAIPRPRKNKELTPKELLAASADAELHVVGMYRPDGHKYGKPVDVEVRPTAKPVVLVLTSYDEAVWNVKRAQGARIKAVLVCGCFPQEVDGLPEDVPVNYFCPDSSAEYFGGRGSKRDRETFFAFQWNTFQYRRMVERLNELTGLLISASQIDYDGDSFVVDGKRGRTFAQKERKPRPKLPKEPTPQELRATAADAELHVVSISYPDPDSKSGDVVDVEVRASDRPIVLALVSYGTVFWNVKIAAGARIKAVILGGYMEQELAGIPAGVPIVCRTGEPSGYKDYFFGHEWNAPENSTFDGKKVAKRLKELTGLAVATFQGKEIGFSFVVDGKRGRVSAQK